MVDGAGLTVTVDVFDTPLTVAVTVTTLAEVTAFEVAVKVLVVAPLATVTDVGTVSALGSLDDNATVIVEVGADVSRIVPVEVLPAPVRSVALKVSADSAAPVGHAVAAVLLARSRV